jgi:hypothetical protein
MESAVMKKPKVSKVGGWTLFERWERNFKRYRLREPRGLLLRDYGEVEANVQYDEPFPDLSVDDKDRIIGQQIEFLRGCFSDISHDSGDFAKRVRVAICNHSGRSWNKGYALFFRLYNNFDNAPACGHFCFRGYTANIFCNDLADIDFASAMYVMPFDEMIIRSPNEESWTDESIKDAIEYIENDLGRDDHKSDFQENWRNGGFLGLYAADPHWDREARWHQEATSAKRREAKAIKAGKSKKATIFSYKKFMRPEKLE